MCLQLVKAIHMMSNETYILGHYQLNMKVMVSGAAQCCARLPFLMMMMRITPQVGATSLLPLTTTLKILITCIYSSTKYCLLLHSFTFTFITDTVVQILSITILVNRIQYLSPLKVVLIFMYIFHRIFQNAGCDFSRIF